MQMMPLQEKKINTSRIMVTHKHTYHTQDCRRCRRELLKINTRTTTVSLGLVTGLLLGYYCVLQPDCLDCLETL